MPGVRAVTAASLAAFFVFISAWNELSQPLLDKLHLQESKQELHSSTTSEDPVPQVSAPRRIALGPLQIPPAFVEPVTSNELETYSKWEAHFLRSSDIFSVQNLACVDNIIATAAGDPKMDSLKNYHIAVFTYDRGRGTSRLRGDMIAAAISTLPGWKGMLMNREPSRGRPSLLPNGTRADFCVVVKHHYAGLFRRCRALGSNAVYWDVLDSWKGVLALVAGSLMGLQTDMLTSVLATNGQLAGNITQANPPIQNGSAAGWPRAFSSYYHQHTNPGFVSPLSRASVPYLCRVALFMSSETHGPSGVQVRKMRAIACTVPSVYSFSSWLAPSDTRNLSDVILTDGVCPDRSEEMAAACSEIDNITLARSQTPPEAAGCFPDQIKYHSSKAYDLVDAVLLLPEDFAWHQERYRTIAEHRPSTRFLHWTSHGIPVVSWPTKSYIEMCAIGGYQLPSGRYPVLRSRADFAAILEELTNSSVRLTLRQRGLLLADRFSVKGVARALVSLHEKQVAMKEAAAASGAG